jgi:hypothetical protein
VFLQVLKLIAGILLALPAFIGVLVTIEFIGIYIDIGYLEHDDPDLARMRFRAMASIPIAVMFSVLTGAGAVYLIWDAVAAMRG